MLAGGTRRRPGRWPGSGRPRRGPPTCSILPYPTTTAGIGDRVADGGDVPGSMWRWTPATPTPTPGPTRSRRIWSPLLTAAVDAAQAAVVEFSGDTVGEYLSVTFEDTAAATHRFWPTSPVTAAGSGRWWSRRIPVPTTPRSAKWCWCAGPTALLAPQWVPWDQRIKPGDLGPGDLLAPPADDPRLVRGMCSAVTRPSTTSPPRSVSAVGGCSANGAARTPRSIWHDGEYGPDSAMARATRRVCRDCGYLLPLAGTLGTMFGVCANEFAADGHVVDFTRLRCAFRHSRAGRCGLTAVRPYDDGVLGSPTTRCLRSTEEPAAEVDGVIEIDDSPPDSGICSAGYRHGVQSRPRTGG